MKKKEMGFSDDDDIILFRTYSSMTTTNDATVFAVDCVEEEDHHHHPHNLSRLSSMCTSNNNDSADDDDGDADEEFSDDKDSEKEYQGCLSFPDTPTRQRHVSSENEEAEKSRMRQRSCRRRSFVRERWLERSNWEKGVTDEEEHMVLITRPKGGRRSLCMDLEEIKACRDHGFELESERTRKVLEIPCQLSCSSAVDINDTSSGENSPISSWRISSPGDDPKEVKARLKVWAQAVALASASLSH